MELNQNEQQILRDLASRWAEIASLPVQKEKRDLWKSLNRSRMQRPMVLIDQHPWNELNTDGSLTCAVRDPFWKEFEWTLRSTIYRWEHFPVDMVVEPFLTVPKTFSSTGYGLFPAEQIRETDAANSVVSHAFQNQLCEEEDLSRICDMHLRYDEQTSLRHFEEASVLFQGILPVRLGGGIQFHLGLWDFISQLMGVTDIYIDLIERPEFMHQVMERFMQSTLSGIRDANELGLHNDQLNTCHCSVIYTDDLLPDFGQSRGPSSKNCWAFGMAQLFTSVSPDTTREFEIPYISRLAEEFGAIYYGCCDRLDDRLELVKTIPNLRKVSCSPWSHREAFAEKIGPRLIMSNKPNPAFLASAEMDDDVIRRDLRRTVDAAKANHVNLEMILKDISTVRYDPRRLTRWAEIAMEEVCR